MDTIPTPFGPFRPTSNLNDEGIAGHSLPAATDGNQNNDRGRAISSDSQPEHDTPEDRAVKVRIVRNNDIDGALESQRLEITALFTGQINSLRVEHMRQLEEMNEALKTALAQVEEVRGSYSNQTREAEQEVVGWRQRALELEVKASEEGSSLAAEMRSLREKIDELTERDRYRDERLRNQRQIIEQLHIELNESKNHVQACEKELFDAKMECKEQRQFLQKGLIVDENPTNNSTCTEQIPHVIPRTINAENEGVHALIEGDQDMDGSEGADMSALNDSLPSQTSDLRNGAGISDNNQEMTDNPMFHTRSPRSPSPMEEEVNRDDDNDQTDDNQGTYPYGFTGNNPLEAERQAQPQVQPLHYGMRHSSLRTFTAAIRSRPTLADIHEARRDANMGRMSNRNVPVLSRLQNTQNTSPENDVDLEPDIDTEETTRDITQPPSGIRFATTEDIERMESRILNAVIRGRKSSNREPEESDASSAESDPSAEVGAKAYGIPSKDKNQALQVVRQIFSERLKYNKDVEFVAHMPISLDIAKRHEVMKGANGPILDDLHMDITSASSTWNHAALTLLVNDIRSRYKDQLRPSVTNGILHTMCYRRWKRLLLKFRESIPKITNDGLMETSSQVASRIAVKATQSGQEERHRVRRRTKLLNRKRVCQENINRIKQVFVQLRSEQQEEELALWTFILQVLEKLAVDGMSSDASVHLDNQQTIYTVHIVGWRSERVSKLLYWLDSQYLKVKASSGSSGGVRAGPATLSQRMHQQKLPRCFYNDDWFQSNENVLRIHVSRKEFEWIELNLPNI